MSARIFPIRLRIFNSAIIRRKGTYEYCRRKNFIFGWNVDSWTGSLSHFDARVSLVVTTERLHSHRSSNGGGIQFPFLNSQTREFCHGCRKRKKSLFVIRRLPNRSSVLEVSGSDLKFCQMVYFRRSLGWVDQKTVSTVRFSIRREAKAKLDRYDEKMHSHSQIWFCSQRKEENRSKVTKMVRTEAKYSQMFVSWLVSKLESIITELKIDYVYEYFRRVEKDISASWIKLKCDRLTLMKLAPTKSFALSFLSNINTRGSWCKYSAMRVPLSKSEGSGSNSIRVKYHFLFLVQKMASKVRKLIHILFGLLLVIWNPFLNTSRVAFLEKLSHYQKLYKLRRLLDLKRLFRKICFSTLAVIFRCSRIWGTIPHCQSLPPPRSTDPVPKDVYIPHFLFIEQIINDEPFRPGPAGVSWHS